MKTFKTLFLIFFCISFLFSSQNVFAQKYLELGNPVDFALKFPDLVSNYRQCIQRGYSAEDCQKVFVICATQEIPLGGALGGFIEEFDLMQIFKVDCGSGTCFQCCHVPGSGCHTSFVGFPVINCNEPNYGAGTNPAGLALLINPEPGASCLFTPQTCAHIAKCSSHADEATIMTINDNPDHIMKDSVAVEQRARVFASEMMEDGWNKYINNFNTTPDSMNQVTSIRDVSDFVLARGNPEWLGNAVEISTLGWDIPQFSIYDTLTNTYLDAPSHYNAIRQLGIARLLSSIPNLYDRLEYVESRIWLESETNDYLNAIGDPDAEFLDHMSPIAHQLYSASHKLQDYRLLAVPLDGELETDTYNGREIGIPPTFDVEVNALAGTDIELSLDIINPGSYSGAHPIGGVVLWGDGSATRLSITDISENYAVNHSYDNGGKYQTMVILQNDSGLRGTSFKPIQTTSNQVVSTDNQVVITNVIFEDVTTRVQATTGNPIDFQYHIYGNNGNEKRLLGISKYKAVGINSTTNYGDITGQNPSSIPFSSIEIDVYKKRQGALIGSNIMTFYLGNLFGEIYDPVNDDFIRVEIPLKSENILLHPEDTLLDVINPTDFEQDSSGYFFTLKASGRFNKSIEIIIDYDDIPLLQPQPTNWTGIDKFYCENRPNQVIEKEIEVSVDDALKPISLITNYPNPFRYHTTLEFSLNQLVPWLNIELSNSIGQLTKSYNYQQLPPGNHRIHINGRELPPGVYYCSVKTDNVVETLKLVKME